MTRRNALVIGLILAGSAGSGSAAVLRQADAPLTLDSAAVKATWRESRLNGYVTFTATTAAAAQLEASLQSGKTHKLILVLPFSVQGGTFTKSLTLSGQPLPGRYKLRLSGTSGDTTLPSVSAVVSIPRPREGVVDAAYTSRAKAGPPARVIRGARQIYAHFHFKTNPADRRSVKFVWRAPNRKLVGAKTKKYRQQVWTVVTGKRLSRGYARLHKGTWSCAIRASGKVTKRISVRVT